MLTRSKSTVLVTLKGSKCGRGTVEEKVFSVFRSITDRAKFIDFCHMLCTFKKHPSLDHQVGNQEGDVSPQVHTVAECAPVALCSWSHIFLLLWGGNRLLWLRIFLFVSLRCWVLVCLDILKGVGKIPGGSAGQNAVYCWLLRTNHKWWTLLSFQPIQ